MDIYLDILKDHQWEKAMRAIAKYGTTGEAPVCENCGEHVNHREGAHLDKTGQVSQLKGTGRGGGERIRDFVKNYTDYGLFCHGCHTKYQKLPQEQKDAYEVPNPDKDVRGIMHNLKIKREAREQKIAGNNQAEEQGGQTPNYTGRKRYLRAGRQAPEGSQEQQGPRGGRYYFKMLQKLLKDQGSHIMDEVGSETTNTEEIINMEKNFYKSKDYQQVDPFGAVFKKNAGSKALDEMINGPVSINFDNIVKADGVPAAGDPYKQGRKVYIGDEQTPPPGVTLYRGSYGGRFYYEGEKEKAEQSNEIPNKPDKKRELSEKVKATVDKMAKEMNNLGNVGKIREVGNGKPDLPHNQGVFKTPIDKQNMPSFNPTANPSVIGGGGNKSKAPGIRNKLVAGANVSSPNMPMPKAEAPKQEAPAAIPKQPTFRPPKPEIRPAMGGQKAPQIGGVGKVTPGMSLGKKTTGPSMQSRGPRTMPFAQFSLADRINKFISKAIAGEIPKPINPNPKRRARPIYDANQGMKTLTPHKTKWDKKQDKWAQQGMMGKFE